MRAVRRIAITLALLLYAAFVVRYTCFVAGGSDSSGYLNAARGIAAGRLAVRVAPLDTLHVDASWRDTFTPLGFSASPEPRMIAPTYPLGYPMHLVPFGAIGGWRHAPFYVTPLMALLCLWVTYAVARELGVPDGYALAAAALLAVAPSFLVQALQPMSDVTAAFWCTFAILCALRAERDARWAAACGVAFGVAVWVRPSNLLLALAIGVAMRWRVRVLAIAVAASLPLAIALMIVNNSLYGSPLLTGYGGVGGLVGWLFPLARAPHYAKWLAITETPLVFPAALLVTFDRRVSGWQRTLLLIWFGSFFVFYCFYGAYDAWWYLRFLLPALPALLVATMLLIRDFVPRRAVAWVLIAVIGVTGLALDRYFDLRGMRGGENTYSNAVHWSEKLLPPDALVVSMQLSGAFYFYSGRFTARYDNCDPARFERLRAYAGVAGLKWYAVVFDWEEKELNARMPGRWTKLQTMRNVGLLRLDS
jgi:hypothetical protein